MKKKNVQFLIFFLAKRFPVPEWMWLIKLKCLTTITEEPCETLVVAETRSCSAALGPPLPPYSWSSTFLPIQDNIQTLVISFFPIISTSWYPGFECQFCCSLIAQHSEQSWSLRVFEGGMTFSAWAVGIANELIKVYLLKAMRDPGLDSRTKSRV